jgi:hypothetical protein
VERLSGLIEQWEEDPREQALTKERLLVLDEQIQGGVGLAEDHHCPFEQSR